MAVAHSGGRSCSTALVTGQVVPHASAIAARSTMASRRCNGWGSIVADPLESVAGPSPERLFARQPLRRRFRDGKIEDLVGRDLAFHELEAVRPVVLLGEH